MLIIGYGKLPTKEKQNRKGPKRVEERERERERETEREREKERERERERVEERERDCVTVCTWSN